MKKILLAACLAFSVTAASAADFDATVGASSDYLYRGVSLTDGKPTVFGEVKADNVLVDGLTLSTNGVLIDASPINRDNTVRTEAGVSYTFGEQYKLPVAVSVGAFRVFNPVEYASDYNELRVDANWQVTDKFSVVGRAAQITTDAVPEDTYFAAGVKYNDFLTEGLAVSVLAATVKEDVTGDYVFSNTELGLDYNLGNGVSLFGTYSIAGDTFEDVLDEEITFRSRAISSAGLVGVKYNF